MASSSLVETEWLAANLGEPGLRIVDTTVHLRPLPTGGVEMESGRASFGQGHRPLEQLRSMFDGIGATKADKVIAYCEDGVNATSDAFVLGLLGASNVAVYDGGLEQWSADPKLRLVAAAE